MATTADLGKLVKSKHPGAYDDMSDADLGAKVKAAHPGSYDDFQDEAPAAPTPSPEERVAHEDELRRQGRNIALERIGRNVADVAGGAVEFSNPLYRIARGLGAPLPKIGFSDQSWDEFKKRADKIETEPYSEETVQERAGRVRLPVSLQTGDPNIDAGVTSNLQSQTAENVRRSGPGRDSAKLTEALATLPLQIGAGKLAGMAIEAPVAIAAIEGAVGGLANARSPDDRALDAALGAGAGAGMHGLMRLAGRPVSGLVRPIPEAERLMARGANLSLRQMDPKGGLGRLSGALDETAWIGKPLLDADIAGAKSVRDLALKTATADGTIPAGETVAEQLGNAFDSFSTAKGYNGLRGQRVDPRLVRGLPARVAVGPSAPGTVRLSVPERQATQAAIDEAMSTLPQPYTLPNGAVVTPRRTVGDLMDARHWLRNTIRSAANADPAKKAALKRAETEISRVIYDTLSAPDKLRLAGLDRAYSNWNKIAGAAAQSENGEFSGAQLYSQIRNGLGRRNAAMGGGGDLRQIAHDMSATLPVAPRTGNRWNTVGVTTGALTAAGAAAGLGGPTAGALALGVPYGTLLAGTKPLGRNLLTGRTGLQLQLQGLINALNQRAPTVLPSVAGVGGYEAEHALGD